MTFDAKDIKRFRDYIADYPDREWLNFRARDIRLLLVALERAWQKQKKGEL